MTLISGEILVSNPSIDVTLATARCFNSGSSCQARPGAVQSADSSKLGQDLAGFMVDFTRPSTCFNRGIGLPNEGGA